MNNLPNNPNINVIKTGDSGLFTNYIYKAIPLAFDESMSYYETLCGILDYLQNTVIPTVNNNADAVAELQTLFVQLKTYVDDYFTNLDVQEEINNKLDAMVKDGTLTELIEKYINPYIDIQNKKLTSIQEKVDALSNGGPKGVYDTLADLTNANPNHSFIYLVKENGHWYYFNTTSNAWTDGGVYQNDGVGNGTVKAQSLSTNLKNAINVSYPVYTEETGKYRMTTGYIVEQSGWVITSPIKLEANETIEFFAKGYLQTVSLISVVSETNTFIRNVATSIDSTVQNYSFSTVDACYVSLSFQQNTIEDLIIYSNSDNVIKNSIDAYDELQRGVNLGLITPNYYIAPNGVAMAHPYGNFSVTDFIKISPNSKYALKNIDWTFTDVNVGYAFYDENKKALSWTVNPQNNDISYTSPNNAYYVRHTLKTSTVLNTTFSLNETINSLNDIINQSTSKINELFASFEKFGSIGDSLSSGESVAVQDGKAVYVDNYYYSWGQYLARKYGMTCLNFSAGGLTTRSWLTAGNRGLAGVLKDGNDCKCYIIALGTNDYALGEAYLGTKEDIDLNDFNNNKNTFYGNYGKIIQNIQSKYPKAKIFVNTMPKITPTENNVVKEKFNDAIREISTMFTNTYLNDLTSLNTEYTTGFLYSCMRGGHYNAMGYNYISQLIDNMINTYMLNNQSQFNQIEFINTDYNY